MAKKKTFLNTILRKFEEQNEFVQLLYIVGAFVVVIFVLADIIDWIGDDIYYLAPGLVSAILSINWQSFILLGAFIACVVYYISLYIGLDNKIEAFLTKKESGKVSKKRKKEIAGTADMYLWLFGFFVVLMLLMTTNIFTNDDYYDYSFDDLEYKNGLYYNERGNLATGKIKGIVPRSEEIHIRGFGNQIFRVQDEVAGQTYMKGTLKDGEKVDIWSYNFIRTEYRYYGYNKIAAFHLEGGNVGLGWAEFNSDNERTSYGRCGEKSEFGIVTDCNYWFSYGEIDAYKNDIMSEFKKN